MKKFEITKRILFLSGIITEIIERVDNFENTDIYKNTFKKSCKQLLNELEKPLNVIYSNVDSVAMEQGFDINNEINHNINQSCTKYGCSIKVKGVKIDELITVYKLVEVLSENTKVILNKNAILNQKTINFCEKLKKEISKVFNDTKKNEYDLINTQNRVLGYNLTNNLRGLFTLFSQNLDKELNENG